MPDDPIVAITRVSEKGLVLIPLAIREKLDLQPGTRMIVVAVEDAVVLQNIVRDEIVGRSHLYYFDCGCVRSYSVSIEFSASESVSACEKHKGLARRHNR